MTITQKPTYLHVIVAGVNSRSNVARYLDEVLRESVQRGYSRVLIEERLEGPRLQALDVFQIASEGARKGGGRLKAIAYVDVNAEGDLMQFAETVAVNRGLLISVFPTVAEAERWLLEGGREQQGSWDAEKSSR